MISVISAVLSVFLAAAPASTPAACAPMITIRLGMIIAFLFGFYLMRLLCHSTAFVWSMRFFIPALFAGVTIRSHPFPKGSSFSSAGLLDTSGLTFSILPSMGATKSDTAFTDSTVPYGWFAFICPPSAGNSTNTISRSCFCA